MTLEQVEYMTNEVTGNYYEIFEYKLGHYIVERYITKSCERIAVSVPFEYKDEYIPGIYYNDKDRERKPRFEIQTIAYGYKSPEEIKKVIAGYQEALEAVEVLTKNFC